LDSVADRPRTHLGDVVYEPSLKRARLQDPRTGRPPRSGYKSNPKPLPWNLIEGKENCTLTMKIGKEHLVPAAREEITCRRALWGTDVYTDDSDVVAACIHAGWIRGEWSEDVDVSMLGLDEGYSVSDARSVLNGQANGTKAAKSPSQHSTSALTVLTEPPRNGPMPVPENRDLHVTLLILPRLEKYASTTRFGIKSREFGGPVGIEEAQQRAVHDGISFMVIGLRWVTNGGASQSRLRGKARRERIRKALEEVAMTPAWISRPANGLEGEDASEKDRDVGLGWWKQNPSKPPSEGDKENMNRLVEPQPREDREEIARKGDQEVRAEEVGRKVSVEKDAQEKTRTNIESPKQSEDAALSKEKPEGAEKADTDPAKDVDATPEQDKEPEEPASKSNDTEKDREPKEAPADQGKTVQNGEEEHAPEVAQQQPEKAAEA